MELRKMVYTDYSKVYKLWMSCAGMGLNNLDDSEEGIIRFLKRNPETCFVATENQQIIGVILVGNDGRRGYIYHTSVHPDYRRRGIAKSLVDKALEALKKLGIHKAALVVFERNEKGNEFWQTLGFTTREDLVYRNKTITEMTRINT